MKTSLKTGFAQIFSRCPKFGGAAALLATPPARTPMFNQIIIVGNFCSVICLWNRPNYGATLSLRAYRRRAQVSEVMVVSLLKL